MKRSKIKVALCVSVLALVSIIVFGVLSLNKDSEYTLDNESINLIVDNLTMFNYANDREERLERLDGILDEEIETSLISNSEKFREGYSYMIGDTTPTAKISNFKTVYGDDTIFITVDYFETNTLKRKMTSIILVRLGDYSIEEVSVYDLFDNLDGNDAGL